MPTDIRDRLRRISPNVLLVFDRLGVDPFKDRFEVTLIGEGTVRGTGGVQVIGEREAAVRGPFVAGDTATREFVRGGGA